MQSAIEIITIGGIYVVATTGESYLYGGELFTGIILIKDCGYSFEGNYSYYNGVELIEISATLINKESIRLDTYSSENIEINMGGLSLLNLTDRTETYSNSFKLPKTPINENVFTFSSNPSNITRPSISVIITKGLFQKAAILTVISFDKSYSCSISYSETIYNFKDLLLSDLYSNPFINGYSTLQLLIDSAFSNTVLCPLYVKTSGTLSINSAPLFISVNHIIELLCQNYGYTSEIDSVLNLTNDYIYIENSVAGVSGTTSDGWALFYSQLSSSKLKVNDILKAICQTYIASILFDDFNKKIIIKALATELENTEIVLNGFSIIKYMSSGYQSINRVNYELDSTLPLNYGGDYFIGDLTGEKETLKINSFVPAHYTISGRQVFDILAGTTNKIVFATKSTTTSSKTYSIDYSFDGTAGLTTTITTNAYDMAVVNLANVYSTPLNPIFINPVILDATRWIDPFTANQIMEKRVINSVQLGGRYWVDSMAYNLATGQSKMKLIKLQ